MGDITRLDIWHSVSINKSNRPIFQENEHSLYVKDSVGLYQGKLKIVNRQNGRIYLTNKRIIYIDNSNQLMSVGVALADVSLGVVIDGFLRSSAKVKVFLKDSGQHQDQNLGSEPNGSGAEPERMCDWVCLICSFNNHVSNRIDLLQELPKCTSCGIRPSKAVILKAIKKTVTSPDSPAETPKAPPANSSQKDSQCSKCTFINHPSMKYCEMCGSELKSSLPQQLQERLQMSESTINLSLDRSLPVLNPLNIVLENNSPESYTGNVPYIKLSFRKGGEVKFHEILTEALEIIKWDKLVNKGMVNEDGKKVQPPTSNTESTIRTAGINGLERIGEQQRRKNEEILSTSLEDLEQFMYKAQDLLKLSNSFSKLIKPNNFAKQMNITNEIIPPFNIKKNSSLYNQELARHISEYLMSHELTKTTSMITSQELFANFNRYLMLTQGFGTELIQPSEFNKSLGLIKELNLPIKLNEYQKSGLIVILALNSNPRNELNQIICKFLKDQEYGFKYEKAKAEIYYAHDDNDNDNYLQEKYQYFRGNTIAELSDNFLWSYGVTIEEIEKCVELGLIVIDQNILGTFYYINKFGADFDVESEQDQHIAEQAKNDIVNEQSKISQTLKSQFYTDNNLVNFNPDYEFGNKPPEMDEQSFMSQPIALPASSNLNSVANSISTPSESMNDLAGLKF